MKIEEARLYLEHTSKDDFNLEEHQQQNRYEAIQVVLKEIEILNNIINEFEEELKWQRKVSLSLNKAFTVGRIDTLINKLQELKGDNNVI